MVFVFDTSSFSVLGNYFPQRFPRFWEEFNATVQGGEVISVREVYGEIMNRSRWQHLEDWVKANKQRGFLVPAPEETKFVGKIFAVPHFQQLISRKNLLQGDPVADPFIIASAKLHNGCVVTEETKKPNAARIPNVCDHFGVACCNIERFMEEKGWEF